MIQTGQIKIFTDLFIFNYKNLEKIIIRNTNILYIINTQYANFDLINLFSKRLQWILIGIEKLRFNFIISSN